MSASCSPIIICYKRRFTAGFRSELRVLHLDSGPPQTSTSTCMPPHSHHCCSRHQMGGAHLTRRLFFIRVSLAPINVIFRRTTETRNSLCVSCSQTSNTLHPQAPAPRCHVSCVLFAASALMALVSSCVYLRRDLQSNFNSASRKEQQHGTTKTKSKNACEFRSAKQHQPRRLQQPNALNSMLLRATVQVRISRGKHGSFRLRRGQSSTACSCSSWRGPTHLLLRLALRVRHYLAAGTWDTRRYSHQFQLVACASSRIIRRSRY